MTEMRLVVVGAAGRMGRALLKAVIEHPEITLAAAVVNAHSPHLGADAGTIAGLAPVGVALSGDLHAGLGNADGVIDFTTPAATAAFARLTAKAGIPHIVGTTGLGAEDIALLKQSASETVVVQSGNMSLGVNLLAALVRRVAATLDDGFDVEILEMHHRNKVDAPSGTALLLGEAVADGRGVQLDQRAVMSREGHTGVRRVGDIGFATLRGGSVVGEHSVMFAGAAERLVLSHHAEDRGIFAHGAVRAALWSRGRRPGFYSMADVLGIADV